MFKPSKEFLKLYPMYKDGNKLKYCMIIIIIIIILVVIILALVASKNKK